LPTLPIRVFNPTNNQLCLALGHVGFDKRNDLLGSAAGQNERVQMGCG
jgi:hypothetical protein